MEVKTREQLVQEFNEAMGQPVGVKFDPDLVAFRLKLLQEEMQEFTEEAESVGAWVMYEKNQDMSSMKADMIKELCDLQYVLSGFAVTFGIDLESAFMEVHKSNMSKLGDDGKPIYREDGKVLKGPNYVPPDMTKYIP